MEYTPVKLLEKYSPKSLEEMKLPQRIHTLITSKMNTKGYRLLLYGTCGIGKSTTARLITKGHDVLYLSGSNNFNIELMRSKVDPFCSSFSINGKQKTLIVDECENMSNQVQDAFKMTLDVSKSVNFIFITNEIEKLIDPFRSRCTNIEYNFKDEELEEQKRNYLMFLKHICDEEKLTYDSTNVLFPTVSDSIPVISVFACSCAIVSRSSISFVCCSTSSFALAIASSTSSFRSQFRSAAFSS